jgi:Holliday junction resolvase RusA-like endonuclease
MTSQPSLFDKTSFADEVATLHTAPMVVDGRMQIIFGVVPSKSNCYRIITFKSKDKEKQHASLAKTAELKQYEKNFILQCNKYRHRKIDQEFKIEIDVYYPSRRADLDNSLKVVLDCLQHENVNAITNDNKCIEILAKRKLDAKNPRIEFTLSVI